MFVEAINRFWFHFVFLIVFVVVMATVFHAIIYKRSPRSALIWAYLAVSFPVIGSILYIMFGINRIERKASRLRSDERRIKFEKSAESSDGSVELEEVLPRNKKHLIKLANLVSNITGAPLQAGNYVKPLINGDEAYPVMLEAINSAKESITFCTYIFAKDNVGMEFIHALSGAVKRGVQVRVLIDAVGTLSGIERQLKRAGVEAKKFMRAAKIMQTAYTNLRVHKKILVVDGKIGFTGGINISNLNVLRNKPTFPVQDVHFLIKGPIVRQLQEAFIEEWSFTSNEFLSGSPWFAGLRKQGEVFSRGIIDGPDVDYDKLRQILLGAIACAQSKIKIITPYFLPDSDIIAALSTASLRGIDVEILIPVRSDLQLVKWAIRAHLWQVLEHGCKVYFLEPPFEHTKIMTVDGFWNMIGSANWDTRSLRLNFEFCVENYNAELTKMLDEIIEQKLRKSKKISLEDMNNRPFVIKIRDGFARLFAPYL